MASKSKEASKREAPVASTLKRMITTPLLLKEPLKEFSIRASRILSEPLWAGISGVIALLTLLGAVFGILLGGDPGQDEKVDFSNPPGSSPLSTASTSTSTLTSSATPVSAVPEPFLPTSVLSTRSPVVRPSPPPPLPTPVAAPPPLPPVSTSVGPASPGPGPVYVDQRINIFAPGWSNNWVVDFDEPPSSHYSQQLAGISSDIDIVYLGDGSILTLQGTGGQAIGSSAETASRSQCERDARMNSLPPKLPVTNIAKGDVWCMVTSKRGVARMKVIDVGEPFQPGEFSQPTVKLVVTYWQ